MSYPAFEGRNAPYGAIAPAGDIFPITPSDTVNLDPPARALYIGGNGDVAFITAAGATRTVPVFEGMILPVGALRVLATGTTASNIFGLTQ